MIRILARNNYVAHCQLFVVWSFCNCLSITPIDKQLQDWHEATFRMLVSALHIDLAVGHSVRLISIL